MVTPKDHLDLIGKARSDVRGAEQAVSDAARKLKEAREALRLAKLRLSSVIDEVMEEAKQPRLPFDEVEPGAHAPTDEAAFAPVEAPTWHKLTLRETGWEDEWSQDVWDSIASRVLTAGELAQQLQAGETFGLEPYELTNVFGAVEMISQDDETPIKFPSRTEPVAETIAPNAGPAMAPAETVERPRSVAHTGIALVIRTDGAANAIKKLKKVGVNTVGELCSWAEVAGGKSGGMSDSNGTGLFSALRSLKIPPRDASLASDAVYSFLKTHGLDPRTESTPPVEPPPVPPAVAIAFTDVPLATIANFPAEVAQYLASRRVVTVEQLDAVVADIRKRPGQSKATRYSALRELGLESDDVFPAGDALIDWETAKQLAADAANKPAGKKRKAVKS